MLLYGFHADSYHYSSLVSAAAARGDLSVALDIAGECGMKVVGRRCGSAESDVNGGVMWGDSIVNYVSLLGHNMPLSHKFSTGVWCVYLLWRGRERRGEKNCRPVVGPTFSSRWTIV